MAVLNACFVGLIAAFITANAAEEYKLELVQVLFRHGDRYPTAFEVETVGEDSYSPIFKNFDELGQLTTTGMAREYKLGQMFRKRYDHFLGDYKPGEVYARSTNVDRTKMSLQLVLAGLYPPTNHSTWSEDVPWRPIPTEYELEQFDYLKIDQDSLCMGRGKLIDEALSSAVILQQMQDYEQMMLDVKNKTAMKVPNAYSAFVLYTYLTTILSMGLPLPEWCPPNYFEKLREASGIFFDALTLTLRMRKMVVGSMVEQMLKSVEDDERDKRKIYLYSAHDTNVGSFVHAHNFTDVPVVSDFGSAVIVEKLRGADQQTYLRMFYWTGGVEEELIPVKLRNCDYTCLVSDYVVVVGDMIPSEEEKSCYARKLCA